MENLEYLLKNKHLIFLDLTISQEEFDFLERFQNLIFQKINNQKVTYNNLSSDNILTICILLRRINKFSLSTLIEELDMLDKKLLD